jgi:hypothetical protein
MTGGQYRGWLNESWLDDDQKARLGWQPAESAVDDQSELFSHFRALPRPPVPRPGQRVALGLDWPEDAAVATLRVRFQTSLGGPWIEVPQSWEGNVPETASLGVFDRETPVSYRIDAQLADRSAVELWGYFQVRSDPEEPPQPYCLSPNRLSLSDYWQTPDRRALFIGVYDCRYRFHRVTLEPISGEGVVLGR